MKIRLGFCRGFEPGYVFDASRIFRADESFDLRRISQIIKASGDIQPALLPLIVHEDNHQLVVFKPPGWLSQPDDTGDASVSDVFAAYLKQKYGKTGNVFCAAVQRLDRPASGLMVLARTSKAAARISEEIREHRFEKRYRVLTDKPIPGKNGLAERAVLVADMEKVGRLAQKAEGMRGNPAEGGKGTQYSLSARLIEKKQSNLHGGRELFHYEVTIETGKFHQIRALFAAHGSPLLGDVKYGGSRLAKHKDRIALVASYLSFKHPTQEKKQLFYLGEQSLHLMEKYFI